MNPLKWLGINMKAHKVIVHKMYETFRTHPVIQYLGWFNDHNLLIKLIDNTNEELIHIKGTSQWKLKSTGDVYFVENDLDRFQKQ